jgi:Alpha amylase inhibitor
MDTSRVSEAGSTRPGGGRRRHRTARVLAGAAVAVAGLAGSFATAEPASAAPPPDCVRAYSWFDSLFQYVGIDNHCGSTQRVKVVVSGGPDSRCYVISPGGHVEHTILWGSWDTNVRC